ncbi:glycoside hydrolase family 3 N-terminal domain-containing protein [Prevotella melaninogenica]|jgi:xylosidase/arabinosidase|uniref:glycoside hydrolase family 3 N-terminal domain-containing protein n=1 Tax=Prevotella melaninogenica TaxID=28132 RepID=UPI001C5CD76D|nr:glycoside hydrolase family 3 N-terminal domain-containing protein [Prevotella melaninogenica]MBW4735262.1 glycoside hydrolase family 3 C-terminal domain-containing protein [Prevotella melaninogenica]MBW4737743.1 glycoside hydrolase family 3 C-terminal domain-containing protein [Prevotella melaninogenica]MBW4880260.1 glycoside hydrolase family 3 C-terminal domain-containing protein [Prevotella melaninogenica]MBW4899418.1 glycoside hydrolase family 3 C-terminal domain-containing protein [Prevo
MKKLLLSISMLAFAYTTSANVPVIKSNPKIEAQVEQTLKKLTLEEKIGQMMELVTDLFGANDKNGVFYIDEHKTDSIFSRYKIGSILNAPNTCAPTAKQWEKYIEQIQKISMKRIGIPCVFGLDQNHGSTYTQDGTLFPQNINIAATFNREIARHSAEATAYETRAVSVPWTYSPTVDLGRDARWPRIWENFGEDCYLTSEMGKAMVYGFQGEDPNNIDQYHIATSLKHFMGYGVPWTGKDRTPAYISPANLREKHFAPFLAGLQAGALTVMVNSASVNGMPMHANKEILTGWLKEETGWDGVLITDWADINNLYTREMVAKDKKDALRIAINAGIDMIMEPYSCDACGYLIELVKEGKIPMSRIDDACRRVLRMKYRLDLFKNPTQKLKNYPKFGGEEFAKLALEGATESMVLLKNERNILPLQHGKKILLTGPNANQMRCLDGGWSYTWQGHRTDEFAGKYNTIYEAFCNEYGKENVILNQGVTYNEKGKYWEENEPQILGAVAAAKDADVIVACIGENSYTETPGNLTDLWLSENQRNLVKALAQTGKPVILVLNEGRPRLIADIEPLAQGIIDILIPGNMGGDALVNLVSGKSNFSGKMPYTYPKEINSLANYDFKKSEEVGTMEGAYDYNAKITQQWGFGYGLSYTSYQYSNLKVSKSDFRHGDIIKVSVDVKNTGKVAGKESILLFSSDLVASMVPDGRRLRAFDKVELQPGETKTVIFELKADDLAFVGWDGKWRLEEGDFKLMIADQTASVHCADTYLWQTANR